MLHDFKGSQFVENTIKSNMVVIKCPVLEILDKNTLVKFSGLGEKLLWA
jgi:hypothetical protein